MTNKAERLQQAAVTLGMLEQGHNYFLNKYDSSPFGGGEDLARIRDVIFEQNQDMTDTDMDSFEDTLAQAAEELAALLEEDAKFQSDPEAPAIGKVRTPEQDGATKPMQEVPTGHEGDEFMSFWEKVGEAIRSKILKPKQDRGPQDIESGDNPNSFAGQSAESGADTMRQDAQELLGILTAQAETANELNQALEARLVADDVTRYVGAIADPMLHNVAQSMFQDVTDRGSFDAAVHQFENRVAPNLGNAGVNLAKKGIGFNLNQSKDAPLKEGGRAPETVAEMIDFEVNTALEQNDLNHVIGKNGQTRELKQDTNDYVVPGEVRNTGMTPATGLRNVLSYMAQQFPYWAQAYTRYLNQALPAGGVASAEVPTAQPFIFPLIRRVYPQLLLTRVGAVYPIDRPDARVFYWNEVAYKSTAGTVSSTGSLLYQQGCYNPNFTAASEATQTSRFGMTLAERTISVTKRALSSYWPFELDARLMAYQNRNPLNEFLTGMADQMARELNFDALDKMLDASDDRVVSYGTDAPSGYTQEGWNDQLHGFIQRASDKIFDKRFREAAFIIADPASASRLMKGMKSGAFQRTTDQWEFGNGIQVIGSVNNFFTVIKTAIWGRDWTGHTSNKYKNKMLLVARGETFSDAGIIYCPFTYEVTPVLVRPGELTREVGIMEQSALEVIIPEMFARVNVQVGTTGTDW